MGQAQGKTLWDFLGGAESSSDSWGPERPHRTHCRPDFACNGGKWRLASRRVPVSHFHARRGHGTPCPYDGGGRAKMGTGIPELGGGCLYPIFPMATDSQQPKVGQQRGREKEREREKEKGRKRKKERKKKRGRTFAKGGRGLCGPFGQCQRPQIAHTTTYSAWPELGRSPLRCGQRLNARSKRPLATLYGYLGAEGGQNPARAAGELGTGAVCPRHPAYPVHPVKAVVLPATATRSSV